jgi:hypothetical protein
MKMPKSLDCVKPTPAPMIIMAQTAHAILSSPAFHLLESDFMIRGHPRCGATPKPGYGPGA